MASYPTPHPLRMVFYVRYFEAPDFFVFCIISTQTDKETGLENLIFLNKDTLRDRTSMLADCNFMSADTVP